MNIHTISTKAREYIVANGGTITQRDEDAYDVDIPSEGLVMMGGYAFRGNNTTMYAYKDGYVLIVTIETGDHRVRRDILSQEMLRHFDNTVEEFSLLSKIAQKSV